MRSLPVEGETLEFERQDGAWWATLAWITVVPGTLRLSDEDRRLFFDNGRGELCCGCSNKPVGGIDYVAGTLWLSGQDQPVEFVASYSCDDSWARVPQRRFGIDSTGTFWMGDDHA